VHWHYLAGVMIYASLAALTYGRSRVFRAERERLWAEWRALRPQLQPHFLFNTLHSVFGLAQLEPASGEAALTRFSRVLRYTLVVHREDLDVVSLRDEWSFVEDYLHLESLRLDGRLSWRADITDEAFDLAVPALLVQPLVENAVRHSGVADSAGITIIVAGRREGDMLVVEVSDNGRGATTPTALGSTGIGLRAVRMRAEWQGTGRDAFAIRTKPGAGFAITLRLPARRVTAAGVGA
jgi:LytS/YehU family sensor histidine kinase